MSDKHRCLLLNHQLFVKKQNSFKFFFSRKRYVHYFSDLMSNMAKYKIILLTTWQGCLKCKKLLGNFKTTKYYLFFLSERFQNNANVVIL